MRLRTLLASAAALLVTAGVAGAPAINPQQVAWAWADQPHATSPYSPPINYSYNSTGGSITITRAGTGTYTVALTGFLSGNGDDVQVTAYGGNHYCNVVGWDSGPTPSIGVSCYAPGGKPADSKFPLLYQKRATSFGSASQGIAFLLADQPTNPSYTPNTNYQYNSTGGTNTITRNDTGLYTALLPGLDPDGGHVQVTAYGTSGRCYVTGWGTEISGGPLEVNIACVDATGAAADEEFNLAFSIGTTLGYVVGTSTPGAYAWANRDTNPDYKPSSYYEYNALTTKSVVIERSIVGEYSVTIPGSPSFNSSLVLVTGYKTDGGYCNVQRWTKKTAYVNCYGRTGIPKDTRFDVTYQTSSVVF